MEFHRFLFRIVDAGGDSVYFTSSYIYLVCDTFIFASSSLPKFAGRRHAIY
jgi:hypothetical protein